MKYKLLTEQNLTLIPAFVDDENTKYDEAVLKTFLEKQNAFGYIAEDKEKAIGFAYGYILYEPDGRKVFYLHAIDIMAGSQNLGFGTELVKFIHAHSKSLGCRKMFLVTSKSNASACRCFEKAGGTSSAADVVMYEYKE